MKNLIYILLFVSCSAFGQDVFYVQPSDSIPGGDDANDGTIEAPWATWQKAFEEATPGDTVYFRGGVYLSETRNTINPPGLNPVNAQGATAVGNSGKVDSIITYMSYPDEWAILDCRLHCTEDPDNGAGYDYWNSAIMIHFAEYITFKDLEVRSVYQCDSTLSAGIAVYPCRYITFDNVKLHDVAARGIHYESGAWKSSMDSAYFSYPYEAYSDWDDDTTRFINVDIYDLCDSITKSPGEFLPGNGADGYHIAQVGVSNVVIWEGCRVWNVSDDAFNLSVTGGGQRIMNNCWAMQQYAHIFPGHTMERNCFKMGGPALKVRNDQGDNYTLRITNSLALFGNQGFREGQHNTGYYYNNTAYGNTVGFFDSQYSTVEEPHQVSYRNNISTKNTSTAGGLWEAMVSMAGEPAYPESHNTWDWAYPPSTYFLITDTVTVTDDDFVTTDSLELVSLFTAPRQADGSLPPFPLQLAEGSDLINAGVDVGLSYDGIAPDIGAFEFILDVEVTGITLSAAGSATTISVNNGTLQMSAEIAPDTATLQTVTWSVIDGTGEATIDQSGLVLAVSDGTVTVRATANDGSDVYGEYGLTLSNQNDLTIATVITSVTLGNSSYYVTSGGNATVTGGAAITAKGICWSTSSNPTLTDEYTVDGTGTGSYTSTPLNLQPWTTYYIRAYATNSEGTAYGDTRQARPLFTTKPMKVSPSGSPIFRGGKVVTK